MWIEVEGMCSHFKEIRVTATNEWSCKAQEDLKDKETSLNPHISYIFHTWEKCTQPLPFLVSLLLLLLRIICELLL